MRNSEYTGIEPDLEELLSDPIVSLLMQSDHITHADVKDAIRRCGTRLESWE